MIDRNKHYTQEEALEAFKYMFPAKADSLAVERNRKIGYQHGYANYFYLWDYSRPSMIVASSTRSFAHALAIVESGNEYIWEEDDSQIADEVSA